MGVRNFLVEGVSGSGKTSVCTELVRRGHHAVHGDRVLAYQGDPETGQALDDEDRASLGPFGGRHATTCECGPCLEWASRFWIWDHEQVRSLVADHSAPMTFFCGGSRIFSKIVELFDAIFVLDTDLDLLLRRLARRPEDEFGGKQSERDFVARTHRSRDDRLQDLRVPAGAIVIDTDQPLTRIVDEIVRRAENASADDRTAR